MRMKRLIVWGVLGSAALAACGDDTVKPGVKSDAGTSSDGSAMSLYQRLGGEANIKVVIGDFVGRVVGDPKINGYFLNKSVDGTRLTNCLVLQVGSLTGGPQVYPSNGCRSMKESHAGMKVSMQDFNDLAGHMVDALKAAKVAQADIDTIVGALVPMATDIVEDATNNKTIYQRVGRRPAIDTVIGKFITRVVADVRINGFFSTTNAMRLKTCLVRQVCSLDGPCKYGQEVDGEPGVSATNVCKDMKSSHMGLTSPPGRGAGSRGITKADFDALVDDLVMELDAAGVTAADKMAILGALGPTCEDIVAGGVGCPGKTIVGLTTTNALVTFDSKMPTVTTTPVAITGLASGDSLVGITFRPTNGKLYALGSSSRLYEVNRTTGAATMVGAAAFAPALMGTNFGFDFNPVVDRIRVFSDQQQNLRLHPDMGVVVDFDAMTMGVQTDTALAPAGAVVAGAYTNSAAGATKTTLYGIDHTANTLVRIGGVDGMPSPNAGAVAKVGDLGVDPALPVGFDIAPGSNDAYASLTIGGMSRLHTVNLETGAATAVGAIGTVSLRAIAVAP